MTQFVSTENRGFQMTFANGWTISVQYGYGNYCSNHHHPNGYRFAMGQLMVTCPDAEIAIWDNNNQYYIFNFGDGYSDTVNGHCSPDEVAKWIDFTCKQEFVHY
jgi:hypothetical protein